VQTTIKLKIILSIFFIIYFIPLCINADENLSAGITATASAVTDSASATQNTASTPEFAVVHGTVFELGSHDTIDGSVVQADGTTITTESDSKGRYSIKIPSGTCKLVFSADGFVQRERTITTIPGQDIRLDMHLEQADFTAGKIVVSAKKDTSQPVLTTITQKEIQSVPGTGGDTIRAIQYLPGVAAPSDFSGQIAVQGGGPDDNLFLIDNIPWPNPFHFDGMISTVNSNQLTSVNLNAAGFGVKWGDYMDSVLDANTRAGRNDRLAFDADINMILSQLFVEGPLGLGDATFTIAGRRSYIDLILGGYLNSMGFTPVPSFWDLGGTLDFTIGKDNIFKAIVLSSNDSIGSTVGSSGEQNPNFQGSYNEQDNGVTSGISWTNRSIQGLVSTLTPYYYWTGTLNTMGSGFDENLSSNNFGIKEEASYEAGDILGMKNTLGFGGELAAIDEDDELFMPKSFLLNPNYIPADYIGTTINAWIFERSLYAQDRLQINKQWAFTPGVRYDKRDDIAHDTLSPRLSLEWQPDDTIIWKAAWGYYSQFPTIDQTDKNIGNPGLSAETAEHFVLSLEKKISSELTARVDAYYKIYNNLVVNDNAGYMPENNGFGIARGLDFFIQDHITDRFFGWIAYSLSNSQRIDTNSDGWSPYQYDQPNILNFVGGYDITPSWKISAKLRYNSGPLAQTLIGREQDQYGQYYPVFSNSYNQRLGDYLRLDIRTEYAFRFEDWRLNVYVEVLNVLNRPNPSSLDYPPDFDPSVPATTVDDLPRLAYFGIEAQF